METHSNNIDVLVYQEDTIAISILRVLAKYPDITLFTPATIGPIIPDIIVLTEDDPYDCIYQIKDLPEAYSCCKKVYIRKYMQPIPIGMMIQASIVNLLTTNITGEQLHHALMEIGTAPEQNFTKKYMTQFFNKYYGFLRTSGLTFDEAVALGLKVRGYPWTTISAILNVSKMRYKVTYTSALKKLNLAPNKVKTLEAICKFGGITVGDRFRRYRIPSRKVHRRGYFLLPQIREIVD